jgi:hypothetical protein
MRQRRNFFALKNFGKRFSLGNYYCNLFNIFSKFIPNEKRVESYHSFHYFLVQSETYSSFSLDFNGLENFIKVQKVWFDPNLWYESWGNFQVAVDEALEKREIEKPPLELIDLFDSPILTQFFFQWYSGKKCPPLEN